MLLRYYVSDRVTFFFLFWLSITSNVRVNNLDNKRKKHASLGSDMHAYPSCEHALPLLLKL